MARLIAITGKAGSGKDTVGEYLVREHGYSHFQFAADLKMKLMRAFDWDVRRVNDPLQKKSPDSRWADERGIYLTPRRAAIELGETYRRLDPEYFIKRIRPVLVTALQMGENVVITDVRYLNEASFLRRLGAELWRVVKSNGPSLVTEAEAHHQSETEMEGILVDRTLIAAHGATKDLQLQAKHNLLRGAVETTAFPPLSSPLN